MQSSYAAYVQQSVMLVLQSAQNFKILIARNVRIFAVNVQMSAVKWHPNIIQVAFVRPFLDVIYVRKDKRN